MTSLIYIIGILTAVLLVTLMVEFVPTLSPNRGARFLEESQQTARAKPAGWRGLLSLLDGPAARWTPAGILRQTRGDLYFAQLNDRWKGWDEVQVTSLRVAAAAGAFVLGLYLFMELLPAAVLVIIGWQLPVFSLAGAARRAKRQFQAQLPEFIQLVAAQMAAGASLEEALRRVSETGSLPAKWMRHVIQMAQGRSLLAQMQREAQESLMPDLISMAVQLEFIRTGTAQQELMAQMAQRIADEYLSQADQRAERVGSDLILPMVIFYFVPFVGVLLALLAYPLMGSLGGGL
jgi:Flp pilus assembly protein TadB